MNTFKTTLQDCQTLMFLNPDGIPGPITNAAWKSLCAGSVLTPDAPFPAPVASTPAPTAAIHTGIATSFADPADIAAFRACKAEGKTDKQCFVLGDNGIGKWGDPTGPGTGPGCALPPDDWEQFGGAARGKLIVITREGHPPVTAKLVDTMPWKKDIKNGAIIDLTTDTVRALGWEPPLKETVTWSWE